MDTLGNQLYLDIVSDLKDRREWYDKDSEIVKRRLADKKKKLSKPYKGAPNMVVPIIDDVASEKTEQEITMIMNAPLLAVFIPLSPDPNGLKNKAERAFDTYLRHVCKARPRLEEACDTKNARGFAPIKVHRNDDPYWGEIPTFTALDPRDVVVPGSTKDICESERITEILRYTPREMRDKARVGGWQNVEAVIEKAKRKDMRSADELSTIEDTERIVGITTSGDNTDYVVVWQSFCYANEFLAGKDESGATMKDRKCCVIFSPDAPDMILKIFPWKEADETVQLSPEEALIEVQAAVTEMRAPILTKTIPGNDKPWPYIQARAESRSKYYYDTRGAGHRCSDDQIIASALMNAKLTLIDYLSQPTFENDGYTNSSNFTAEPGSVLPRGLKYANMPQVPPQLDFGIDYHKRESARRMGAGSQYVYSENVSNSRKIQKTATEVQQEQNRVAQVSSASVDRFNDPWRELFSMLWQELVRMKKPLPMIQNDVYIGDAGAEIYSMKFLIVPAASAKTLHPDMQFARAQQAMSFVAQFAPLGVPADFAKGMKHALYYYDPNFADQVLIDPMKAGPQGQPPIYAELGNIKNAMGALADVVDKKTSSQSPAQAPQIGP